MRRSRPSRPQGSSASGGHHIGHRTGGAFPENSLTWAAGRGSESRHALESHPRPPFAALVNAARAFRPQDSAPGDLLPRRDLLPRGDGWALCGGPDSPLGSALSASGVLTSPFPHAVELFSAAGKTPLEVLARLGSSREAGGTESPDLKHHAAGPGQRPPPKHPWPGLPSPGLFIVQATGAVIRVVQSLFLKVRHPGPSP